jgi:outer membrane receptor protein involved in Fe transport
VAKEGVTLAYEFAYRTSMNKHFSFLFVIPVLWSFLFTAHAVHAQFGPPGGGPPGGGPPGMGGMGKKEKTFNPNLDDDQPRGNSKITGVLIDSLSGKPVEFATIALINTKTGKPIDGTTSDEKGKFALTRLAPGSYRLQYSFIGYRNRESSLLTVVKGADLPVGSVKLQPDVRTLGEVVVTGQAALIENKVDRLVYNADKDLTAKGGDATDVMRKVPMLSVDLDGNVSLRGSQNVKVLINNKPSTIVASSVADALKQIPADMIKSVEVITSPSAKYDAEGSAGIINIVTKKNTLAGGTLNLDTGVGNRGSNLALNGSYRQGKMGFTLGGFGRAMYNVKGAYNNTQTTGQTTLVQTANTLNHGLFGTYQLGWDYDIDKTTSLSASVRYGVRNMINSQNNLLTQTYLPTITTPELSGRNVKTTNLSGTIDASLTYTKTYKTQKELSLLGLYSRNNNTNDYVADLFSGTDWQTVLSSQKNLNPSYNQESTLQADYQTPIKTNQLVELGAKGIFRQVSSDYSYYVATGSTQNYEVDNSRASNALNYDQTVAATYLSYTLATKSKYTIKAGARYEYTFINAQFSNESSGSLAKIPGYGVLVPSLNLSKNLRKGRIIKIAYNRRIQRPGIQFLNPNVNASNPTNISIGNPSLSPELTDNVELGLGGQVGKIYLNTSFFGRRTTNSITSVRDTISQNTGTEATPVYQKVIRTSYQNIGHEDAYGVNIFANGTFFSKLQLGGSLDIYHTHLTNSGDAVYGSSNAGWVLGGGLFSTLTLTKGWAVQAFGGGRGRQIQLQGYQGGFAFYNLGIRKDIAKKRGSIGLVAENFFNHPFKVRTELTSPILSQNSVTSMYNAGVRVNFTYRLGKMSFDGSGFQFGKRKKSINNDDVKGDTGNQQQQQGQGSGQTGGPPRP